MVPWFTRRQLKDQLQAGERTIILANGGDGISLARDGRPRSRPAGRSPGNGHDSIHPTEANRTFYTDYVVER